MQTEDLPFRDLLIKIVDNRGRTCPTTDVGMPLIATNCIKNDSLYPAFEKVRYVSDETYQTWFRGHPEPGDLIFVNKGTPGRVCMTPDPVSFCIAQDMVAIRANPKKIYPKYLFAALRSREVQNRIGSMHVGTLIPHFKKGDFDKLLIPVPSNELQETIGDNYFVLSAKIELNRRINDTLAAMARALFTSWFIDFDPVRAKAAGCDLTCLDAGTVDLFPSELVLSDMGKIPKGWSIRPLSDVIDVKHGFAFGGEHFRDEPPGDILLTPGNFAVGGGFKDDKVKYYVGPVPEDFVLQENDLVLTMTDLSKASDTLGYPAFVPRPPSGHRYLHNQRLGRVKITKPDSVSALFLYQAFSNAAYRNEILASATGTTVKHTSPNRIKAFKIVLPPPPLMSRFEKIAMPWYRRSAQNCLESRTLAVTRDALSSKLLSGEMRIRDAQTIVP
jgi:type I restriction enzyme S subunit